jgi:hypothetical protein
MYEPTVGRFLNEDPIGFNGGDTNTSRYCKNSPTILVDPTGLFGDWGHSHMPNIPDGHGGYLFDWTREDHGWGSPFNPFSTWRHFRDLKDVEADLAKDVANCDVLQFERHMHQLQDYYSHYSNEYRWYWGGHIFDANVDSEAAPWFKDAQKKTQEWLEKWIKANMSGNGNPPKICTPPWY